MNINTILRTNMNIRHNSLFFCPNNLWAKENFSNININGNITAILAKRIYRAKLKEGKILITRHYSQLAGNGNNEKEIGGNKEEEILSKNIHRIFCFEDLWQLIGEDFRVLDSVWGKLPREPEYHTLYLKGKHILTLDRDKYSVLRNFQMEINSIVREHIPSLDHQKGY